MIGDTKKIYGPHEWANQTERGKKQKGRQNKHKEKRGLKQNRGNTGTNT